MLLCVMWKNEAYLYHRDAYLYYRHHYSCNTVVILQL